MPSWKKIISSGSDAALNSLTVTNGITSSLFGTASYATTAGNGGVTKILAGSNVNISPVNGLGDVTVTSFGTNLYNTATGSYGSFYDTGSVLASSSTTIYSMSLSTTYISNGVYVSASNGDVTRLKFTNAGTYNVQFSAQFSNTDNSTQDVVVWVKKNGTDIVDSSGTVGIPPFKAGSNGQALASWNYYLNLSANDYIQLCWHTEQANVITLETIAAGTSPVHPRTPSLILTAQRVDTFLSNTGSFSGSFTGTFTGSLQGTSSYASTASYVNPLQQAVIITGSLTVTGSINTTDSINMFGTAYTGTSNTIVKLPNNYYGSPSSSINFIPNLSGTGNDAIQIATPAGQLRILNTSYTYNYIDILAGGNTVFSTSGPNTGTTFTINTGGSLNASFNWDNTIGFNSMTSAARPYRFLGATNYSFTSSVSIGKNESNAKLDVSGSAIISGSLTVTQGITGSISSASFASTSSYVLNAVSASFASTASFVTTLNQNVLITGSLTVGTSSIGASENTITLGARDGASEGGQLGLNAPGGTYTSASFIDNWQNQFRILRGTNATSDATVANWNLHTKQMQLPQYTNASSFVGTATANLAVDSGGNIITVSTTGGSVFPYTGNAVITGSLTTTGIIFAQPNGGMYFQGGDDAALYDLNVVNTMGIYGVQNSTLGAIKLGSSGPVLYGSGSNLGINTTNPSSASLTVNGNVWATSLTGSLLGTASFATTSLSASFASTASFFTGTITSASFASTASFLNSATNAFIQNGNSFGATALLGTNDNQSLALETSGSTRMFISSSGNVGIGTSAPTASLHISGASSAALFKIESPAVNNILFVSGSGNVGIGTRTPTRPLHIKNTATNDASKAYILIDADGTVDGAATLTFSQNNLNWQSVLSTHTSAGGVNFGLQLNDGGTATFVTNKGKMFVGNTFTIPSASLHAKGSGITSASIALLVENSSRSTLLSVVDNGFVGIGITSPSASFHVAGTTILSSSFNTAISGSTLKVQGSGSGLPIFTVVGSQGELFSINDSLSGSLFSVNDISGLPILEVFSDNTILLGNYQSPTLYTTNKIASSSLGSNVIYSFPTSSYDGVFIDYTVKSGSNARAGNFTAIWSGTSVNYMDNSTTDFGSTAGMILSGSISGSNLVVFASGSTAGWTFKGIIRSI